MTAEPELTLQEIKALVQYAWLSTEQTEVFANGRAYKADRTTLEKLDAEIQAGDAPAGEAP